MGPRLAPDTSVRSRCTEDGRGLLTDSGVRSMLMLNDSTMQSARHFDARTEHF